MKSVKPILFAAICMVLASAAQAQTLYRSVGPDGRVTFSDTPPPSAKSSAVEGGAAPALNSGPSFPYELQQVVNRFPVTLYSGSNCSPCAAGRNYLTSRGVPFTERTVNSPEDIGALQRLAGEPAGNNVAGQQR